MAFSTFITLACPPSAFRYIHTEHPHHQETAQPHSRCTVPHSAQAVTGLAGPLPRVHASSRSTNGPIHVSYPGFEFATVGNWTGTLANAGVEVTPDAYGGENYGAYIATNSINPANWTRSYARSGYIDPLPPRDNLAVLPNATVTRIIFDSSNKDNLTATAVEWASSADAARETIKVRKEVIISSGAMGSPRVLMHSGVGPSDVLQAAGVDVQVSLPGVGQHLQDHLSSGLLFQTNTDTAASLYASNATGNTPIFLSYVNSAVAYVNSTVVLGADGEATLKQQIRIANALSTSVSTLVPSSDHTVKAGYEAIRNTTLNTIFLSGVAQIEILYQLTDSGSNGTNVVAIQAGLQHPFSHGRIYITSSDPFVEPLIDLQYLAHSADIAILHRTELPATVYEDGREYNQLAILNDDFTLNTNHSQKEDAVRAVIREHHCVDEVATRY
ncbi:hypothetical protein L226DRAFT_526054 [Lentinus tigrinus ALCF2SS1-7]|uniref:uncharacterized protein n=1 Tax=Lentinus tigrinus ALCF2SS1-7 TaxID=1328758 RepID=UPI0011662E99|nr:hypothetical protein L226DRAFT_526054 [Lentinus tigrinus ALCF2SS1-7]